MRKALGVLLCGALGAGLAGPARAASFQELLPGARANAVGAYGPIADGPYSLFHNPAGLSGLGEPALGAGLGRVLHPAGVLSVGSFVYAQPWAGLPRGVVAAGWFGVRQGMLLEKDVFALSFAETRAIPYAGRLRLGGSVRAVRLDAGTGAKGAVGVDGGAQWEPRPRLRLAAAVLDLDSHLPAKTPSWHLGGAYDFGDLTLAGELRMREGLAVFYPGAELRLGGGLLDARFGKAVSVGGVSQLALGWGVRLDPWRLDFAMSVPWRGLTRQAGSYEAGLAYRFGGEPFTSRFLGRASAEARGLAGTVEGLKTEETELKRRIAELRTERESSERQLRDARLNLEAERLKSQMGGEGKAPREAAPPAPQPGPVPGGVSGASPRTSVPEGTVPGGVPALPSSKGAGPAEAGSDSALRSSKGTAWPKKHVVRAGDTLRSLAAEHYGDPALWERIYQANPDKVLRGLPEVGAELSIPAPGK